jgi:hypothetical protein
LLDLEEEMSSPQRQLLAKYLHRKRHGYQLLAP